MHLGQQIQRVLREADGAQALWSGVLERALLDLGSADAAASDAAWTWFGSDADHIGSFHWTCLAVGLDPAALRGELMRVAS